MTYVLLKWRDFNKDAANNYAYLSIRTTQVRESMTKNLITFDIPSLTWYSTTTVGAALADKKATDLVMCTHVWNVEGIIDAMSGRKHSASGLTWAETTYSAGVPTPGSGWSGGTSLTPEHAKDYIIQQQETGGDIEFTYGSTTYGASHVGGVHVTQVQVTEEGDEHTPVQYKISLQIVEAVDI